MTLSPLPLLRLRDNGPQWPYSVAQFRADEPQLSISSDPHPGELASYASLQPPILIYRVQPTDPPEHDPATHRVGEVMPVETDGVWQQSWELVPIPAPEPPADWGSFKLGLLTSADVAQIMTAARAAGCGEPAASALPVALEKAQSGNFSEFAACWGRVVVAGKAAPEALAALAASAEACHLPADFVAALQLERERARDDQGRFVADDPTTPQDEAWASVD